MTAVNKIAENELREQIAEIIEPLKRGAGIAQRNEAVDQIMELFAKAKQAWTVEARVNELKKLPKLSIPDTHKSQKYRDYGKFIYQVYLPKRLAELQPPTAESEVKG